MIRIAKLEKLFEIILEFNFSIKVSCEAVPALGHLRPPSEYSAIVNEFKYLGVVLDSKFDFHTHIQLIENKISRAVGIISKLKHIFPSDALLKLYYSLLHPYLLYGFPIWGSTYKTYQARLGALQNRSVKLIGGGNFRDSPNLFYSKLYILKLPDLFKHETAKLVYGIFHDDLLTTLTELFVKNSNITNRITRFTNNREMTLYIPSYTSSKMQRSMKYQGVKIWNSIYVKSSPLPLKLLKQNTNNTLLLPIVSTYMFFIFRLSHSHKAYNLFILNLCL